MAGFARVLDGARGRGEVVLEIHGGTIHPSASSAHRIVSHFDPTSVGVIYDPQNMVRDGFETTSLALRLLGPYVAHVHVGGHRPVALEPNPSGPPKWRWEGCPMSEGLYHYPDLMTSLKKLDYKGFISVEDFRPGSAGDKFQDAIHYLRSLGRG